PRLFAGIAAPSSSTPRASGPTRFTPTTFNMKKILLLISALSLAGSAFSENATVWFNSEARLEIDTPDIHLAPSVFSPSAPPWTRARVRPSRDAAPEPGKPATFSINLPKTAGGGALRGVVTFTPTEDAALTCRYEFTP